MKGLIYLGAVVLWYLLKLLGVEPRVRRTE